MSAEGWDLKDYLSMFAIVIATISLIVSISNVRYTRRVKAGELKLSLIQKILEVRFRAEKLNSKFDDVMCSADREDISVLLEQKAKTMALVNELELAHKECVDMPLAEALNRHEANYHKMVEASERVSQLIESYDRTLSLQKERNGLLSEIS